MSHPLPPATTSVRTALVSDIASRLLFRESNRRFYLVQNQSGADSLLVTSVQNGTVGMGQIIGPTGAKIVDAPAINELWARNITSANQITVTVEEIVGYSPFEIRLLAAMERVAELLEKGARK